MPQTLLLGAGLILRTQNKDGGRASQSGAAGWDSRRRQEPKTWWKESQGRKKKKKIEMGKKYGNAHSNSTAKHGSRAPPPMTVLAGCRGRHYATQGKT